MCGGEGGASFLTDLLRYEYTMHVWGEPLTPTHTDAPQLTPAAKDMQSESTHACVSDAPSSSTQSNAHKQVLISHAASFSRSPHPQNMHEYEDKEFANVSKDDLKLAGQDDKQKKKDKKVGGVCAVDGWVGVGVCGGGRVAWECEVRGIGSEETAIAALHATCFDESHVLQWLQRMSCSHTYTQTPFPHPHPHPPHTLALTLTPSHPCSSPLSSSP